MRLCFLQERSRRDQTRPNPGVQQAAVCAPGPTLTAEGCWRAGRPAAALRPPRGSSRLHPPPTAAREPPSRPPGRARSSTRKSLACLPLSPSIRRVWPLINGARLEMGIAGPAAPKGLRLHPSTRSSRHLSWRCINQLQGPQLAPWAITFNSSGAESRLDRAPPVCKLSGGPPDRFGIAVRRVTMQIALFSDRTPAGRARGCREGGGNLGRRPRTAPKAPASARQPLSADPPCALHPVRRLLLCVLHIGKDFCTHHEQLGWPCKPNGCTLVVCNTGAVASARCVGDRPSSTTPLLHALPDKPAGRP